MSILLFFQKKKTNYLSPTPPHQTGEILYCETRNVKTTPCLSENNFSISWTEVLHMDEESRSRANLRVVRLYVTETGKEIKQRKLNFCLGSCSVFIVVLVIALLLTVLANAPVLYLSLGQQERGEMDLLLVNAERLLDFDVANATALRSGGSAYTFGCPRLLWEPLVLATARCAAFDGPYASSSNNCSSATSALAKAHAIHDQAERRAALGREWTRTGFNATAGNAFSFPFLSFFFFFKKKKRNPSWWCFSQSFSCILYWSSGGKHYSLVISS